jgi:hypothetical protein
MSTESGYKRAFLLWGMFEPLRALIVTDTAEFDAFSAISVNSSGSAFQRTKFAPQMNYAQVVTHRVKGRVVKVTQRVVFGCAETIRTTLSRAGHRINTAFIERVNLTLRANIPALARKVLSFAKTPSGLAAQVSLSRTYYNFCLPHQALRLPLPEPLPTKGHGSPKLWQGRPPAMAAGVTPHSWSMSELLLFRVPPGRHAKRVTG